MPAPLKILYADDEAGWRELVAFWLKEAGYETRIVSDGKSVMPLAAEFKPDCFLLDHDLGDTTGHAVCEAIKSSADFRDTPVILLTAHAATMHKVIFHFPPDQFIVKSDHPEELILVLVDHLKKKKSA